MHEDYRLAYCSMAYIAALAFADDVFQNARLTPEIMPKLRVPGRLHVLPLIFKKSMWNTPIFRSTVQTVAGVHTHPPRPMLHPYSQWRPKTLGEFAWYHYPIHYYCLRLWVANVANRKLNYTPTARLS